MGLKRNDLKVHPLQLIYYMPNRIIFCLIFQSHNVEKRAVTDPRRISKLKSKMDIITSIISKRTTASNISVPQSKAEHSCLGTSSKLYHILRLCARKRITFHIIGKIWKSQRSIPQLDIDTSLLLIPAAPKLIYFHRVQHSHILLTVLWKLRF